MRACLLLVAPAALAYALGTLIHPVAMLAAGFLALYLTSRKPA